MSKSEWQPITVRIQQDLLPVLILLSLGLFIALALQVNRATPLTEFDQSFGFQLRDHRQAEPAARSLFFFFTETGSVVTMTTLAILSALVFLFRRCYGLALICLLIPGGGALLNQGIKAWVDRPRPEFKDAGVPETNESFPSGHSQGSIIGYGLLGYLLIRFVPGRRVGAMVLVVLGCLVLLIGFSRIYLGAHFFSDVVGGYALGTAWLAAWILALEARRQRAAVEPPAQA